MEKMKILVVEDEIIIADNICDILKDLGYVVSEPAISYSEAIVTMESFKPDLVLLDINLSGKKTGIDIAAKINVDYKIPFIFLTSYTDNKTLENAKKVRPSAYLVKPFTRDDLFTSIEIALSNSERVKSRKTEEPSTLKDYFFVKQNQLFVKIYFKDILFLKSDHVYVDILTNDKNYLIRTSLNDVIHKLNKSFIRVHRSYIINIDMISEFDHEMIIIQKHTIPLGKNYKSLFFEKIDML